MNESAIQNLDYLRQLISELRTEAPYMDIQKLRMLQGYGVGTDAMTNQQEGQ